jgi:hypothetical protein
VSQYTRPRLLQSDESDTMEGAVADIAMGVDDMKERLEVMHDDLKDICSTMKAMQTPARAPPGSAVRVRVPLR